MSKYMTAFFMIILLVGVATLTFAQKETELYIPIGKSPGISGKYSVMGRIEQVNYQNQTLTMSDDSHSYDVKVSERTMFFLDRTKLKETNVYGTLADCKKGMLVEVRFENDERGRPAQWVKVQVTQ